ncbi:HotDog domain-containing protein [Clohesyomyces aquaticus]|uniref:HotDog domain-containing protein n=1 Tax=Clohesyomyces aquaticus TaxID=1231657 RepID=A0A1Y1YIF5_9PLEO|nr:HotDog domain-containing protein [Clohesyomyces aquaticus]
MSLPDWSTHLYGPKEHFEDFTRHEWCRNLLADPSITQKTARNIMPGHEENVSNSFFKTTLFTDGAVRAFLSMFRPGRKGAGAGGTADDQTQTLSTDNSKREDRHTHAQLDTQTSLDEPEALMLVSLGDALDGGINRLHGGVTATLLDHVMGVLISFLHRDTSATAELAIKYKIAIKTPMVLLCRARIVREKGRWIETVGWIEDGEGTVFAEGKGAFVKSRSKI